MAAVGIGGHSDEKTGDYQSTRLDFGASEYAANFEHYYKQKIYPVVAPNLHQESSIHSFEIGSLSDPYFIDLRQIYCNISWKVVREDGSNLDETDDKVSIVNSASHSLFEQIDVSINGIQISDHTRYTHFRSFLTNCLSISSDVKKSLLIMDFWKDDDDKAKTKIVNASFEETGIKERSKIIATSNEVNSYFKPMFDLATSERDLPGGNVLRMVFTITPSDFLLLYPTGGKSYKVKVTHFEMEVGRYLPPKSIQKSIESKKKTPLVFPLTR